MRKLHAVAAFGLLLFVSLACKKGELTTTTDAGSTSSPSVVASDPASTTATAPGTYKVGDTVDVEWSGSFYESQILAVQPGPQYKIHYVGWSDSYDEVVGPSRIRARAAGSTPSGTAVATTSPSAKIA